MGLIAIVARKTKEDSQLTREAILDAAESVIFKKGMSYTTMADIADAANVSRGAVYGHYKGKVEVATAMVSRTLDTIQIIEKLEEESHLQYLYRLGLQHLHLSVDPGAVQRVLLILYIRNDDTPELIEQRVAWEQTHFGRVKRCINQAIAANELATNTDPYMAALYFQTLLDGIFCSLFWSNYCSDNQWETAEKLYKIGFEALKTSRQFLR